MADKKISALTAAATPLDGTEVLPIVQSGATVKVANNDLRPKQIQSNASSGVLQITGPAAASTRVATVPNANWTAARTDAAQSFTGDQTLSTGNLIQGTAAKGFNFTANTPAAGMTSQLLNWYEQGTFTPTYTGSTTSPTVVYDKQNGKYTRIGNTVTVWIELSTTSISAAGTGNMQISGLPFTSNSSRYSGNPAIGYTYGFGTNAPRGGYLFSSSTTMTLTYFDANTSQQALPVTNLISTAGNEIVLTMTYQV
jgi:hypothetical protein